MKIKNVKFITSSPSIKEVSRLEEKAEYAFIGRSNVGKSSLINMLTNSKLAKTSSNPGKTQLINHYMVNEQWYLVDLPGYGYAKTSKIKRAEFMHFSKEYLLNSTQLRCIFLLIDIRIKLQQNDLNFMNWLGTNKLPFIRVFSKAEKLNNHKIKLALNHQNLEISKFWETPPSYILTSAKTGMGKDEILNKVEKYNALSL
tara:strand:- start:5784 stop:6383 length:600 start_codon:yes stop_codon:yes gene_type:complete